jgi:hypothetical protein
MKKTIMSLIILLNITTQAASLEALLGLAVTSNSVKIRVASSGCTSKASFDVKGVTDSSRQAVKLLFVRTQPDTCETGGSEAYLPNGVVLTYNFDELGIKRGQMVYVGNPFGQY